MKGSEILANLISLLLATFIMFELYTLSTNNTTETPFALERIKLKSIPIFQEPKNEASAFDKYKCLSQLNVDEKPKMRAHWDKQCSSFPLKDEVTGMKKATFDFCTPFLAKYVIAERANECGQDGYWISDPRGCMRQFAPAIDEDYLKGFMVFVGFSESRPAGKGDSNLVFFSDTCKMNKETKKLDCGLRRKDDSIQLSFHLTPNLIPYPLYDVKSQCPETK